MFNFGSKTIVYSFPNYFLYNNLKLIVFSNVCDKSVILGNLTAYCRPKTSHIPETGKNCHEFQ